MKKIETLEPTRQKWKLTDATSMQLLCQPPRPMPKN